MLLKVIYRSAHALPWRCTLSVSWMTSASDQASRPVIVRLARKEKRWFPGDFRRLSDEKVETCDCVDCDPNQSLPSIQHIDLARTKQIRSAVADASDARPCLFLNLETVQLLVSIDRTARCIAFDSQSDRFASQIRRGRALIHDLRNYP
jgi:hypothetical protein